MEKAFILELFDLIIVIIQFVTQHFRKPDAQRFFSGNTGCVLVSIYNAPSGRVAFFLLLEIVTFVLFFRQA
jgi:hypothetical protein